MQYSRLLWLITLLLPWSMGAAQCPLPDGCERDGKHYYVGEQFSAADGCNTCTCYADGVASCTAIGCL